MKLNEAHNIRIDLSPLNFYIYYKWGRKPKELNAHNAILFLLRTASIAADAGFQFRKSQIH